jgi:hypothetical protein
MPKVKRFDTVSANSSTTRIFLKDSGVKKDTKSFAFHRFIMNFKRKINFDNLSKKIELNKHFTMPFLTSFFASIAL